MIELPSTKAKQREHIARLMKLADNEYFSIRAASRDPSPDFRLLQQGLRDLYEQMFNRKGPRGRPVSDTITPAKIKEVFQVRAAHPSWSQQEIAYYCNINIGRVSEILHGKRT